MQGVGAKDALQVPAERVATVVVALRLEAPAGNRTRTLYEPPAFVVARPSTTLLPTMTLTTAPLTPRSPAVSLPETMPVLGLPATRRWGVTFTVSAAGIRSVDWTSTVPVVFT